MRYFWLPILIACAPQSRQPLYGVDQCMRREIFMACLQTVTGGQRTIEDSGDVVDECESAAQKLSGRQMEYIKDECRD